MTAVLVIWTFGKAESHARLMWAFASFDLVFATLVAARTWGLV